MLGAGALYRHLMSVKQDCLHLSAIGQQVLKVTPTAQVKIKPALSQNSK